MTDETTIACTKCGQTAPRPAAVQWRPLWDAGWRWIGSAGIFSCPDCPPLVLEVDGCHRAGPGLAA